MFWNNFITLRMVEFIHKNKRNEKCFRVKIFFFLTFLFQWWFYINHHMHRYIYTYYIHIKSWMSEYLNSIVWWSCSWFNIRHEKKNLAGNSNSVRWKCFLRLLVVRHLGCSKFVTIRLLLLLRWYMILFFLAMFGSNFFFCL